MSVFQIVAVSLLGVLIAVNGYRFLRGKTRRRVVLFWLVLWIVAIAAIIAPNYITNIAKIMGVQRGADLVLYSAVLTGLVGFFYVYLRLRIQNRQVTVLTREIALLSMKVDKVIEPNTESKQIKQEALK